MAIFKNRPLALACAGLLIVTFLAYFLPFRLLFVVTALFAVAAALFLILFLRRKSSYTRLFVFLLLAALCIGTGRVLLDSYRAQHVWKDKMGEEVRAEISVIEVTHSNAYGAQALVRVHTLNGKEADATALLRTEQAFPFYINDRFVASVSVHDLSFEAYDEGVVYHYRSEGATALLLLKDTDDLVFLESGTRSFAARWNDLRATLSHRMTRVTRTEETRLLTTMLLGSREALSDATVRDFRSCGVSHLLALSGLHLVVLVGIFDLFLRFLCFSRRARIATVVPISFLYLMLTGCNYSLLRAMLMLGFVYLAFLLRGVQDGITSLFLGAALIVLCTPYAVFSTSFQMTVLATLGILSFGKLQAALLRIFPRRKGVLGMLLHVARFASSSVLISLSTSLCMLPVLWLTIGNFSLLTPLANLLLVPLSTLLLLGAVLLLLFPFSIVAHAVSVIPNFVLFLTGELASHHVTLSFQHAFVPYILIPVLLLTLVALVIDLKKLYPLAMAPLGLGILAFAIALCITRAAGRGELQVLYRHAGNNEGLVLVQNDIAMLCDLSTTSTTQLCANWREAQELGATRLSVLLLTHYHSKSATAIARFSQTVIIENLWLVQPQTQKEREMLAELLRVAQKYGLSVTLFEPDDALTVFGNGKMLLHDRLWHTRSTEPAFSLSLAFGEKTLCYHSAALSEYLRHAQKEHACHAEELILGAHGPVPHEAVEIPQTPLPSRVLVGSEEVLSLLKVAPDVRYLFYPEKHLYVLE